MDFNGNVVVFSGELQYFKKFNLYVFEFKQQCQFSQFIVNSDEFQILYTVMLGMLEFYVILTGALIRIIVRLSFRTIPLKWGLCSITSIFP